MHEEIEYAEMLEIPVSTVNVVKRRHRQKKSSNLQQSLIEQVNEKISPSEPLIDLDAPAIEENQEEGQSFATTLVEDEPTPPTSRWTRWQNRIKLRHRNRKTDEEDTTDAVLGDMPIKKESRAAKIIYRVEFGCAGALCLGIFLTNIFMPHSAINTFFRSMTTPSPQEDSRVFSDFTLTPIVGEYSSAVVSVSPEGVISFTAEGCVYPAVDGVVTDVIATDGKYTVKLEHSPVFTSILEGVDYVYYQVGDSVKHNVPVAFSNGETPVQMTLYAEGEPLDCLQVDDSNTLAWVETRE